MEVKMTTTLQHTQSTTGHHTAGVRNSHPLAITPLGNALGLLLAISFTLCVAFDLLFPSFAMYPVYIKLLPGVTWLSWTSFALGLVETFAYGWYVALIFVPLYNYFRGQN